MLKRFFILVTAAAILQACGSGSSESSTEIDYATLDSLQTEVALEIGESADYIPGSLSGLVVTNDNEILVSDWGSTTLEQFDAEGNHMATVAAQGGGPGEISRFFSMQFIGDTLILSQQSRQQDYFAKGENGVFQFVRAAVPERLGERTINRIGAHTDSTYYATTGSVIRDIQEAAKNENEYRTSAVVVTDMAGNVLQDSLYLLKKGASHIIQQGGGISIFSVPYRFEDEFVMLDDGAYMIARADSNTFNVYDRNHQRQQSISLNIKERPVTGADLEYEIGDLDASVRNEIEARIQDQKPPYLNVYATGKHIWLHTDTGPDGKEIVVIDYDGNALGKFTLPEVDLIKQVKDNRVYTIHRSPEQGDVIRAYRVQI